MDNHISDGHLDALKEVGTMGAGRAATALCEIINLPIEITVPDAKLVPSADFAKIAAGPDEERIALVIALQGELHGRVFFLISPDEARSLGALLLGQTVDTIKFEDPMFQSAIKEALNIIVGAYMSALSELTGIGIMFSIPYLALDVHTAVFIAEQMPQRSEDMILIETRLKIKNNNFGGFLLFFPDMPSIKRIFKALNIDEKEGTV